MVKYGGHAMGDEAAARSFARDMVLLEQSAINPVVVHGGGPQIGAMLKRLGIKSEFAGGPARHRCRRPSRSSKWCWPARSTSRSSASSTRRAASAVGLCGKDGNMVTARKVNRTVVDPGSHIEKIVDLGFVGEPEKVDTTVLDADARPRADPGAGPGRDSGRTGGTYNVNADTFAGAIAGRAEGQAPAAAHRRAGRARQGQEPHQGALMSTTSAALIADGTITGGMIPKVETCIYASSGRRRRRHSRRQGRARGAAGAADRSRRRNADPPVAFIVVVVRSSRATTSAGMGLPRTPFRRGEISATVTSSSARPDQHADARFHMSRCSDVHAAQLHRVGARYPARRPLRRHGSRGAGRPSARARGRCLRQRRHAPLRVAEAGLCGGVPQSARAQCDPLRHGAGDRRHHAAMDRPAPAGPCGPVDVVKDEASAARSPPRSKGRRASCSAAAPRSAAPSTIRDWSCRRARSRRRGAPSTSRATAPTISGGRPRLRAMRR